MLTTGPKPDTLERLESLDTGGHPVLSVYLSLDPREFAIRENRMAELNAVIDNADRHQRESAAPIEDEIFELNRRRTIELIAGDPDTFLGARALAIFSCAGVDVLEAVRLPAAVEPFAVIDYQLWLEPLADQLTPGRYAVAVVGRREARLLVGGSRTLAQFAVVNDDVRGRHSVGGWSQSRYQRNIEEGVDDHLRHVTDILYRAHQRESFDGVLIVASPELAPRIEHELHADLTGRMVGTVDANLEHAPAEAIATAVRPLIAAHEAEAERLLLLDFDTRLGIGGNAAAGVDEVLAALAGERVETLLLQRGIKADGRECDACGGVYAAGVEACRVDGEPTKLVDAIKRATEIAAEQNLPTITIDSSPGLAERGGVGALLRW